MAISAPGIGSNLDVNSIVTQLMAIERAPLDRIDRQEISFQAQLSAYGNVRSALSSFQSAIDALSTGSRFRTRSFSSSDTTVASGSASSTAQLGSYTLNVTQIAQAQSLVAAGQASSTAAIGTGASTEIRIEFGTIAGGTFANGVYSGATFTQDATIPSGTVTIDTTNNSLAGIRDAINDANLGVRASIVNDGGSSPNRLVLQSVATGESRSMKISVTGDSAISSLLSYDPETTQNLTQTAAAQNAEFTVNGLAVESASNSVTGAVEGVSFTLLKSGTSTVNVSRSTTEVQKAVQDFVKAYNDLNSMLTTVSAADPAARTQAPLNGDAAVRTIQTQLRSVLGSSLGSGFNLKTLSEVGISFQRDGSLALDSSKLSAALDNNADDVEALFASSARSADSLVKVTGQTSRTLAGTYALSVTTLATQGTLVGTAAANTTITAGVNDALSVVLNDVTASVRLSAGTYTAASLAATVQASINGASVFSASGFKVSVTESAGVLTVTSGRYGADSSVAIGGNGALGLLGASPVATDGVDVAGSIGGIEATGSGQILTAADGSSAEGLRLEISGGTTGARGDITVGNGFAARLSALVEQFLESGGTLASRTSGINRSIKDLDGQRESMIRRLTDTEQRFRDQYTRLDTLLSSMRATSTFLTQQLAAINRT